MAYTGIVTGHLHIRHVAVPTQQFQLCESAVQACTYKCAQHMRMTGM